MDKIQRKRQSVTIAVFAVIAIISMAFGYTLAFFSDKLSVSNTITFGKLKLQTLNGEGTASTATNAIKLTSSETLLASGDKITLSGSIGLEDNSVDSFVRMKLTTTYKSGETVKTVDSADDTTFKTEFLKALATITDTMQEVIGPQIKPPKVTITSDGSYFKNRIIGILPTTIVT